MIVISCLTFLLLHDIVREYCDPTSIVLSLSPSFLSCHCMCSTTRIETVSAYWSTLHTPAMSERGFFQFKCIPGSAPSYRFNGGTKAVSEMSGQCVEDMLKYVHKHATINIETDKECIKSKEESLKFFKKAKSVGGIPSLKDLNNTIRHLPNEDTEISEKVKALIKDILIKFEIWEDISNEKIGPKVSKKLKIEYKEGVGRHVIAAEDILVGETIVREKPFVSFLHNSHQKSNCLDCMRPVLVGFGCDNCSQVIFCSENCKTSAQRYHKDECGYMKILPGFGPLAPVIRIFTSESVQFFTERVNYFNNYDKSLGDLSNNDSDFFMEIFNLQAGNKTSSQYKIDKAAYSYFIICILKKIKYFENNKDEAFDSEHVMVGKFIDHFLKIADLLRKGL